MKEEKSAATKMQAAKRGKDAREQVREQRAASAAAEAAKAAAQEDQASVRLGAGAKGYMARKRMKKEREEMAAATTRIQANFKGKRSRAEVEVLKKRRADDPAYQAEKYLQDHKLLELFELLGNKLVTERPADPRAYLVQELTQLKSIKDPSSPMNFFSEQDVETLFSMYDVSGKGLTRTQCVEAFDAMGVSASVPPSAYESEKIDRATFLNLLLS